MAGPLTRFIVSLIKKSRDFEYISDKEKLETAIMAHSLVENTLFSDIGYSYTIILDYDHNPTLCCANIKAHPGNRLSVLQSVIQKIVKGIIELRICIHQAL